MKAVIPAAGIGTRLRPHTHTAPKALLQVAGKPIIGHILDGVRSLGVNEVVLIVGYMGRKILTYVQKQYPDLKMDYVYQRKRKGLGHAVWLTRAHAGNAPIWIVYGDTIFEGDLTDGLKGEGDGAIGVKRVEDPSRFGVVQKQDGWIVNLVEKPETFVSDLAIVGVNYIRNTPLFFESLQYLLDNDITTKGEYQLTDAFRVMIQRDARLAVLPVTDWFDCGEPETLLATNRHLLSKNNSLLLRREGVLIVPPVYLSESAEVVGSILGPWVSVGDRAKITNAVVRDSILGEGSQVESCMLDGSLVGDGATVRGSFKKVNIGDSSMVELQ